MPQFTSARKRAITIITIIRLLNTAPVMDDRRQPEVSADSAEISSEPTIPTIEAEGQIVSFDTRWRPGREPEVLYKGQPIVGDEVHVLVDDVAAPLLIEFHGGAEAGVSWSTQAHHYDESGAFVPWTEDLDSCFYDGWSAQMSDTAAVVTLTTDTGESATRPIMPKPRPKTQG